MWDFDSLRELLFKKLEKFVPLYTNCVDEILVVHKYNIESRFLQAYQRLALRDTPLTFWERERLGHQTASKISEIREKHLRRIIEEFKSERNSGYYNGNGYYKGDKVDQSQLLLKDIQEASLFNMKEHAYVYLFLDFNPLIIN